MTVAQAARDFGLQSAFRKVEVQETERSIANKMSRGSYWFVFFLQ